MRKKKSSVGEALVLVFQFGLNMIVPIGLMSALGWWIGEKTGLSWMMLPFFIIGALAGGNSVYRMAKRFIERQTKE